MLFCFGLFALLLYYTVVANAECSYTYRNSSQHIEAESRQYERQGYQHCEFIIQTSGHHSIELNFTRLVGFGASGSPGEKVEDGNEDLDSEEEKEKTKEGVGSDSGREFAAPANDHRHHHDGGEGNRNSSSGTAGKRRASEDLVLSTSGPAARRSSTRPSTSQPPPPPALSSSTVLVQAKAVTDGVRPTSAAHTARNSAEGQPLSTSLSSSSSPPPPPLLPPSRREERKRCSPSVPKVEIRVVSAEGQESLNHVICQESHNYPTPVVFHLHYASSVRIVYVWRRRQSSGFTLYFDFDTEDCPFTCDGHLCLRKEKLCDKHFDCQDQADERQALCQLEARQTVAASGDLDSESLVKIVAIVTCLVVLVLLTLACIVGRHYCSPSACTMHRDTAHSTGHLACPQSQSSEGFTPSAESLQDCSEQAVALLPNGPSRRTWTPPHPPPPPPDLEIGLPPNIPVSPDGEEGYTASQMRLLDPRYRTVQSELFKPPPNKTVFDRESPPPYSPSPSSGSFGCGSAPSRSSPVFSGGTYGYGSVRVVRDSEGQPVVSRCYSMFTPSMVRNGAGNSDRSSNTGGGKSICCDSSEISPQHRSHRYAHQQRHHHHQPAYEQQQQQRSLGAFGTVNTVQCPTCCPSSQLYVHSSLPSANAIRNCDTLCWNLPAQQHFSTGRAAAPGVGGESTGGSGDRSCGNGVIGSEGSTARGGGGGVDRVMMGAPPDYTLAFSDFSAVNSSLQLPDSSGV